MDTKRVKLRTYRHRQSARAIAYVVPVTGIGRRTGRKRSPRDLSRAIHSWIDNGLPAKQDKRGHWWLDGRAVAGG